jgi:hypothetical protein
MLSLNSKHVQHVKIYLACNFKVNLITVANQKQELPLVAIFVGGTERNGENL